MMDEGYIKFSLERQEADAPLLEGDLLELNCIRTRLFKMKLIGILDNGIGYGNVSIRSDKDDELFIISGSATGGSEELSADQYCAVLSTDITRNYLVCRGSINASSESMSHAAVYEADENISCVIHIHDAEIFQYMLGHSYSKTPESAAYGTPEIAYALKDIVKTSGKANGVVVMAGHEDGVIAYGADSTQAFGLLKELYDTVK